MVGQDGVERGRSGRGRESVLLPGRRERGLGRMLGHDLHPRPRVHRDGSVGRDD